MFKTYFDYLEFVDELKKNCFEIEKIREGFIIVESCGHDIASVTEDDGVTMTDIRSLLEEDIDEIFLKDILYDYNRLIYFVLSNVDYKP